MFLFGMVATLAVCVCAAAEHRRYAAVNMSPVDGNFIPRFFLDAPKLAIRDGGICGVGQHSCLDVGYPDMCCENTDYCYIRPDNTPRCCQIGSKCDSQCDPDNFQCTTVVTIATIATETSGSALPSTVITSSISSACCGRKCTATSNFRCGTQFGGGCCAYGATCALGNNCIRTVTPSTSATALLTPVDPKCTATTQYACEDGEGCCDNLMRCTMSSGTPACAPGNPTASGVSLVPNTDGGLSSGAKAGIGVGVAVVGCAIAGFLAWFCLVRRRRRAATTVSGDASRTSGGVSGIGTRSERPGRSARAMSEVTATSRPTARRGVAQDYFGPDAVAGPYTETVTAAASSTPAQARGVPLQAHSPNDITAAVEIDSRGVKRGEVGHDVTALSPQPTTEGRYELYGSELASTSPPLPSPPLLTPRSVETARPVSMLERSPVDISPGAGPSHDPRRGY